jgi:hypothetical protein
LTDESTVTADASYPSSQNMSTDSMHYYHTIQFLEIMHVNNGTARIIAASAEKKQLSTEFKDDYSFYENNLQLHISKEGRFYRELYNYPISEYFYYEYSTFWDTNIPISTPLYVDWVTDF